VISQAFSEDAKAWSDKKKSAAFGAANRYMRVGQTSLQNSQYKEAGKGTQLSPAPNIVNAVYDAIGIDFMELPLTREKVHSALVNNIKVEGKT
jgi:hypothetical protein